MIIENLDRDQKLSDTHEYEAWTPESKAHSRPPEQFQAMYWGVPLPEGERKFRGVVHYNNSLKQPYKRTLLVMSRDEYWLISNFRSDYVAGRISPIRYDSLDTAMVALRLFEFTLDKE